MEPAAGDELIRRLQEQVDNGLKSRREKRIKAVFEKYCDVGHEAISLEYLGDALAKLNVEVEDLAKVFDEMDMDRNQTLDFTEFRQILNKKSAIQEWASTLQLDLILADAIPNDESLGLRTIPANNLSHKVEQKISALSKEEIDAVCVVVSNGLRVLLSDKVAGLKPCFSDKEMLPQNSCDSNSGKFQTVMNCGSVDNFHQGLEDRVGYPHTKFRFAMRIEHTVASGHDHSFQTSNYNITTTPMLEWRYVVDKEKNPCPKHQMTHGRRIPDLQELQHLDICRRCKLTMDEIISIVLYTGPMFLVYNGILRRFPESIVKFFVDQGNRYSTTIMVLTSAVSKLSRVAKLPQGIHLYRGMAGCVLPQEFTDVDDNGCSGFAEWAFMSTTEKKEIALQYSGMMEKKPDSKVFVIATSSVDRGARVQSFSQYPGEIEYIWPPLSFVQRNGPPYLECFEGLMVTMIPVKVNSNLKIRTVEDILSYKKRMHLTAFDYLLHETQTYLNQYSWHGELHEKWLDRQKIDKRRIDLKQAEHVSFEAFTNRIMTDCKAVRAFHEERHDFSSDDSYKSMVVEMLNVKQMAISKMEFYLMDRKKVLEQVHNLKLIEAHRARLCLMQQHLRQLKAVPYSDTGRKGLALELCKMVGLVVDGSDANHSSTEPKILEASFEGWNQFHFELMLECKANFTEEGTYGITPIIAAAQMGHTDTIKTLVKLGNLQQKDLNHGDIDGWNGIIHSVMRGNMHMIKTMIELGADPALCSRDGRTAFMYAAIDGDIQIMEYLCSVLNDEQITMVDHSGHDAIFLAGAFDQYHVLEWAKSSCNTAVAKMARRSVTF